MDYREKISEMARSSPLLPTQVAKAVGRDSLTAGAMLSEMSSKGLLRVSRLKVGGSPLYYIPENVHQLKDFVEFLNEKDRRTVKLLEERGVLCDRDQEPLVRVSLHELKDFALPLKVSHKGKEDLFYKWFLLPDDDAKDRIRSIIEPVFEPVVEEKPKKILEKVVKKPAKIIEKKSEGIVEKPKLKRKKSAVNSSEFINSVESFFGENNITIIEKNVIRKDDVEFMINLPSPFGSLAYFCKVKGKKRITDSDLSSALVAGQLKKVPILFLFSGELSKSARELLPQLKGFVAKRL